MQPATYPALKHLVLIGGGHSHAIALKRLGMSPIAGLKITLISDCIQTPYSGMLPGHVAGFYTYDETHIDLNHLARFAQIDLLIDRAVGLDLEQNRIVCAEHPPLGFDLLSIDIGSTPQASDVPGVADYAIAAKPVPQFLQAWSAFLERVQRQPEESYSLVIVGGGAGGVELALNMATRLAQLLPPTQFGITLIQRGARLLPGHNRRVARQLTQALRSRGITIHCHESVKAVTADVVYCASGLALPSTFTVWVTQASAPSWLAQSGLATCERGFVLVKDTLQSCSHAQVFAAGDIATMQNHPRPKAGVFAVRQGPPLAQNWRRQVLGQPLQPFKPQQQYLALIGTGDRQAVASWSGLCWRSARLWRWKDHIDRVFMAQFENLPAMTPAPEATIPLPPEHPKMYCAGCGSKLGASLLQDVMARLEIPAHPDAIVGLAAPDDAAVLKICGDYTVQTIDQFRTMLRDPYRFGQIAALHSLSDLWAMGATAQTVLATVTIPYATERISAEVLFQVLSGVLQTLNSSQTALVGGHSTLGDALALGLACYGTVERDRLLTKSGLQPGQALVLTKPLGTGTLLAADQQGRVRGRDLDAAIAMMGQSNQAAAQTLQRYGATACTDVTGFGLVGHLVEMIQASGQSVQLTLPNIPVLPGAIATLTQGITSSLQRQNRQAAQWVQGRCDPAWFELLFDPQTAGGLLASLPAAQAVACVQALQAQGYGQAAIVGQVMAQTTAQLPHIELQS
ncbi:MAG: selenide, water dikinase SelD [Spirulina sp. SIO3F2]|nr:selenide, water dikinase SelD [Spirulina sp. SIO3F2]